MIGLVLRVLFVELFSDHLRFGLDAIWYQLTSGLIVDGKGLSDPEQFFQHGKVVATAFRVPLYPTFLAGISQVFDSSRHTFQLVGCFVGTSTILLTGFIGRRVAGEHQGIVAAAIVAASPARAIDDRFRRGARRCELRQQLLVAADRTLGLEVHSS